MSKTYLMKYDLNLERGKFTKEEIGAKGGCDAFVLVSILRGNEMGEPHKGVKDIAILSYDGRQGEDIPNTEMFQVFAHLAHFLKDCEGCPEWQRTIANATFEVVCDTIKMMDEDHAPR